MKRSLTGVVALAAVTTAAAALAACSSSGPASGGGTHQGGTKASTAPVTLTFWGTYGNGGNKAQTDALNQTIIPAFEKQNPNIKINYVDIPYNSLLQKLTTGAAAGQLPDLVRSDIAWVAKFASLNVFAQLDGTLPKFSSYAAADYPGTVATTKYQGHYYGLPLDTNTRVLISNMKTLSSVGISAPPKTFAELRADGAKLAAKGIPVFADSGLQAWNILPWIWSGGGAITSPDGTKASGYLNSAKSVAAVQMLVDMYKHKEIPNLITGNTGATSTQDGLPKGTYATILDGPWMAPIFAQQYKGFHATYSPMPAGAGGSISVVGGEDIVMTEQSANSSHLAADEKFLAFTQSPQYQLPMAKTGQMSVVSSLGAREVAATPYLKQYVEQLQTAKARPEVPDSPQIDTVLQDDLTPAFEGHTSVQNALNKAAAAIDPLLTATH